MNVYINTMLGTITHFVCINNNVYQIIGKYLDLTDLSESDLSSLPKLTKEQAENLLIRIL